MGFALGRYWWVLLIQGIAAVLYGILAFVWPGLTLGALIMLFGAFAIVYGIAALVDAFSGRGAGLRWLEVINGLVAIAAGVVTFVWPGLTALALLYLVAAWALVVGIFEVAAATRPYFPTELRWAFGLAGVASIILGVLLIAIHPAAGLIALVWMIGLQALIAGIAWIYAAIRLRRLYHDGLAHGGALPA